MAYAGLPDPVYFSNTSTVLALNGVRIEGFSNDDPPVEFPDIQLVEEMFGRDGHMYVMGTGLRGGDVVIKLLPTSPSIPAFMDRHAMMQLGRDPGFYYGEYSDRNLGFSTYMYGGYIKQCPPAVSPGKTFEVTLVFQELRPQFKNARTR